MIEAENSIAIGAPIAGVWGYVQDINRWANLFPGCRECHVIDEHNSRWVIKVGAGGLVRTVNVLVQVERWDGPGRVDFSYRLEAEPVVGSGSYLATAREPDATEITLKLRVEGSGSMAPMWEAVSRPLLPQLAKSFSGKLKVEIENWMREAVPAVPAPGPTPSLLVVIGRWLARTWHKLFAPKGGAE